jgi:hypothetical protein
VHCCCCPGCIRLQVAPPCPLHQSSIIFLASDLTFKQSFLFFHSEKATYRVSHGPLSTRTSTRPRKTCPRTRLVPKKQELSLPPYPSGTCSLLATGTVSSRRVGSNPLGFHEQRPCPQPDTVAPHSTNSNNLSFRSYTTDPTVCSVANR